MLTKVLLISTIAGIISIDVRTIGGTMISRPLVVAPVIGLILGDLRTGFLIATLLEFIWIGLLPVGAYLPIETLPIAVISTSLCIILNTKIQSDYLSIMVFCIIVAVPFGFIGRWTESHIRTFNSFLADKTEIYAENGNIFAISTLQYFNIVISFLKGFIICFVPVYLTQGLLTEIFNSLPVRFKNGMHFSSWIIPCLGFAIVMEIFMINKYIWYFFSSFIIFLLILFLTPDLNPFLFLFLSILTSMLLIKRKCIN